mmetsp:Transcript_37778/g.121221  ORF Transcript_37778/g.121221 Transcript_37778/m.121221 type:complete len:159 (+) Transcript_37778:104-580(+)
MLIFAGRVFWEVVRGLRAAPLKTGPFVVLKRAHLMDCDFFLHVNNAMVFRLSELCRWRLLSASGLLGTVWSKKWGFLVAEQSCVYRRQIPMARRFTIATTVASSNDDKWLHYTHIFMSLDGEELATTKVRAVLKLPNGKTVAPSEAAKASPWFADQLL